MMVEAGPRGGVVRGDAAAAESGGWTRRPQQREAFSSGARDPGILVAAGFEVRKGR